MMSERLNVSATASTIIDAPLTARKAPWCRRKAPSRWVMPRPASAKASSGIAVPTAKPRVRPTVRRPMWPVAPATVMAASTGPAHGTKTAPRAIPRTKPLRPAAGEALREAVEGPLDQVPERRHQQPEPDQHQQGQARPADGVVRQVQAGQDEAAEQGEDREAQRQAEDDQIGPPPGRLGVRLLPRCRRRGTRREAPAGTHGDRPVMIPPTRPISTSVTPTTSC